MYLVFTVTCSQYLRRRKNMTHALWIFPLLFSGNEQLRPFRASRKDCSQHHLTLKNLGYLQPLALTVSSNCQPFSVLSSVEPCCRGHISGPLSLLLPLCVYFVILYPTRDRTARTTCMSNVNFKSSVTILSVVPFILFCTSWIQHRAAPEAQPYLVTNNFPFAT